ncbi:MAG: 4'-phosphopantetheinyl transferase superfamily protein, partial [Candidatus Saelkia tenebricola]|nr:4'-phosphopantetheinyl transferase superfamily protein [Candidatus Saelkia tenebricola]
MKILSTGIDIVEVKRIKNIYFKFGTRFLDKVLTLEETSRLEDKGKSFYQSLAGRIAAKEAVYKALNSYDSKIKPKWQEITVYNQDNGSPAVSLKITLE